MGNSSVLGAGRDVPRSWGELTPIEPAQQPRFLYTPRGSAIKKQVGLRRTACAAAAWAPPGLERIAAFGPSALVPTRYWPNEGPAKKWPLGRIGVGTPTRGFKSFWNAQTLGAGATDATERFYSGIISESPVACVATHRIGVPRYAKARARTLRKYQRAVLIFLEISKNKLGSAGPVRVSANRVHA